MRYREPQAGGLAILGLTAARVALGAWWLLQYRWKPPPGFGCPDGGFCLWLSREIQYPYIGRYVDALRLLVLPHPLVAAWLVFALEVAIGISLVLGFYTRLFALVGMLWSLVLLAGLVAVPGVTPWYYVSASLLSLVFLSLGAMSQLALDRLLSTRSWWAGSG
jgi:uncharacterized membrane protein YphA (DoxX/SURF4 family)